MKKMITILVVLMFTFSLATADGIHETKALTISLDANATTGYSWNAFILSGDSVIFTVPEGTYVADQAPEGMVGVGGQTYYTLIPVKPGVSLITFTYGQAWNPETAEQLILLADVDEELNLWLQDVTNGGVIEGTVTSVNENDHSVLLSTESHGEILARFGSDMEMPVVDEHIVIYTNGTMTMSLPAIMNVLAWNSVPSDLARTDAE